MKDREPDSIVYIGGDMRPMIVVEADQYRDDADRARRLFIKLRPQHQPEAKAHWYRSDMVTGG